MSQTLTVAQVNEKSFGIKDTAGNWHNLSRYTTVTLDDFVVGQTYEVEKVKGKNGGAYIDKIIGEKLQPAFQAVSSSLVSNSPAKPNEKDLRISAQGLLQAAVLASAHMSATPEMLKTNTLELYRWLKSTLADVVKEGN